MAVAEELREALLAAVQKGDAQAVAAWLDEGGGVDAGCAEKSHMTLLIVAANGGHETMVRMYRDRLPLARVLFHIGCLISPSQPVAATELGTSTEGHLKIIATLLTNATIRPKCTPPWRGRNCLWPLVSRRARAMRRLWLRG